MADRHGIFQIAEDLKVAATTVEKDYTLGWMLAGIATHPEIGSKWVFKGGTCIKKCHFGDYRFSEDLDFTVVDPLHANVELLSRILQEVAGWVELHSGIEIPAKRIVLEAYQNPHDHLSIQGKLYYRGPLQMKTNLPKVKIDFTFDELVVRQPVLRLILHPYAPTLSRQIACYDFEELFAEKLRALAQRSRARDLYDVVNLFRQEKYSLAPHTVRSVLQQKCSHRGVPFPTLTSTVNPSQQAIVGREWSTMLAHQLPQLEPIEVYWERLPDLFSWLEGDR